MALTNNVTISVYRCPSSDLPEFYATSYNAGQIQMISSYTGIAGSTLGTTHSSGHGELSGSGMLFPHGSVKLEIVPDGTSNTMIVGEQSRHLLDANNSPITGSYTAITSQGPHGWTMGGGQGGGSGATYGDRSFNASTIAYQINTIGLPNSGGTGHNTGRNIPLSSSHTGGAVCLLADGSVRFFRDSTPLTTLQFLANRNDGNPIPGDS